MPDLSHVQRRLRLNKNVHYIAEAKPGIWSSGPIVIDPEFLQEWQETHGNKYNFYGPFTLARANGLPHLPYKDK